MPTAIQDPAPFERQGAHSGWMRTPLSALLTLVNAGPERTIDRLPGPLDQALARKGGALPAPMHPGFLSAALGDRGNTGALLELRGVGIAIALLAEGGEQSRRQDSPCSRQRLKQHIVRQRVSDGGDFSIEAFDGLQGHLQLCHERLDQQRVRLDDSGILSERHGVFDHADAPCDHVGGGNTEFPEKTFQCCSAGLLGVFEGRLADEDSIGEAMVEKHIAKAMRRLPDALFGYQPDEKPGTARAVREDHCAEQHTNRGSRSRLVGAAR